MHYFKGMSQWEIIRNWLNKNKIFFETIVMVFLTIMSVTVTYTSNEIASNQIDINKMENQPIFHIYTEYVFPDSNEATFTHDQLVISNSGSSLYEFKYQPYVFLKVEYWDTKPDNIVFIPLEGYYFFSDQARNLTGRLVTIKDFNNDPKESEANWYKIEQSKNELYEMSQKNNMSTRIGVVKYIFISYKDIYGNYHEEMFLSDQLSTVKINRNDSLKIIEYYDEKISEEQYFEIDNLSTDKIYEMYSTIRNES